MTPSCFAVVLLLLAPGFSSAGDAAAPNQQRLDLRFEHEGRTFHQKIDVAEGVDVDFSAPVPAEDKASSVLLHLRASLGPPDAYGKSTLLYQMTLKGADDAILIESQAAIYVRPGTYSTVAECGDWKFNLGLISKYKSGLRTGDDVFTVDMTTADGLKRKCSMHIKPGSTGSVAVEALDPGGKKLRSSFKLSPGDQQQFGGAFSIPYEISFPGYAMSGAVSLAPRKSQWLKQGRSSSSIWFGQDN